MLVEHLFNSRQDDQYDILRTECSQFISETDALPVYRSLSSSYADLQRVKVRHHKKPSQLTTAFNKAFVNETHNIIPRGVFTQSVLTESNLAHEPFYVFPINGYNFLYSKGVQNSNVDLNHAMSVLAENAIDAVEVASDLIRYTYTNKNLVEGINAGSEIIFYNIPYFYAVRVSAVSDYHSLINK